MEEDSIISPLSSLNSTLNTTNTTNNSSNNSNNNISCLNVTPRMITFPAPWTRPVNVCLVAKNKSETDYVAFKVKTTQPNRYFVRPSTGLIGPLSSFEIQSMHITKHLYIFFYIYRFFFLYSYMFKNSIIYSKSTTSFDF